MQQKPLEGALEVFVVFPLAWALAEAVTEQGKDLSAGVRQEQRIGKLPQRSCLSYCPEHLSSIKISAVTFKDQVQSEDLQSCFSMRPPATLREGLGWPKGSPLVLLNLTPYR